jgi:CBS domain-containing protein
MTPREKLITARLDDPVEVIMERMTNWRVRHIPIMNGDQIAGLVSIGDVVKLLLRETLEENIEMRHTMGKGAVAA